MFDSDTLVMPVDLGALDGISVGHSRINYGVVSFGQFASDPVDFAGFDPNTGDLTLSADVLNPGVSVAGRSTASRARCSGPTCRARRSTCGVTRRPTRPTMEWAR